MSPVSAEAAADPVAAKRPHLRPGSGRVERLLARFHQIRDFTNALCAGLEPEDCVVQSMPDVSPTKWHLAHTTWFFETFILKKFSPGYRSEIPQYAYLFNSYYNAAGDMHRRDLRGLISRPTVREAKRYRASIDSHIDNLLSKADEKLLDEIEPILILGFHHEQQHQELLVTDIKHVFAQNPLYPVFREAKTGRRGALRRRTHRVRPSSFIDFEEAIVQIGHDGRRIRLRQRRTAASSAGTRIFAGFTAGNKWRVYGIHRRQWLCPSGSLVIARVDDRERTTLGRHRFIGRNMMAAWWNFTLSGFRPVDESEPVTHVSYFEADAYANWAGARLANGVRMGTRSVGLPDRGKLCRR